MANEKEVKEIIKSLKEIAAYLRPISQHLPKQRDLSALSSLVGWLTSRSSGSAFPVDDDATDLARNCYLLGDELVEARDYDPDASLAGIIVQEPGTAGEPAIVIVVEDDPTGDTYEIVLAIAPTHDVTVVIFPHEDLDVGVGFGAIHSIDFTTQNWSSPQTITVKAQDGGPSGQRFLVITHSATSSDPDYGKPGPSLTVTVDEAS